MGKQDDKSIICLVDYIQPFMHFVDDIKNSAGNFSCEQYPLEVLHFMDDVCGLTKENYGFLGIMNQREWWDRTVLEQSISQMTEKDILFVFRAIIERESRFKGFLLQYFREGLIVKLLQRIIEIKKPFYNMTLKELSGLNLAALDSIDLRLHHIAWTRKEQSLMQCDVAYEEYCRLLDESVVQKRIDGYSKMAFKDLEELTKLRQLFQYNDQMGMSLFDKIYNNMEELNKLDISEMPDEEFIAFYHCYKCALEKKLKVVDGR